MNVILSRNSILITEVPTEREKKSDHFDAKAHT